MADPRIPLKNHYLAAVLAYLVPGAGHVYQGRTFKGILYFVCILGAYIFGLSMSHWKAVYYRMDSSERNIAFFAQAGVGMFAIPAFVQSKRYSAQEASLREKYKGDYERSRRNVVVDELPISAPFVGEMAGPGEALHPIKGQITISKRAGELGEEIGGTFSGQILLEKGHAEPIELRLDRPIRLDPLIGPGAERWLDSSVVEVDEASVGNIQGFIPRSLANHLAVPLGDNDIRLLSGELGKFFELAKIFTWIAGLLNILAVWDALEGPAYGYGDEEESTGDSDPPDESATPENPPVPAEAKTVAVD